MAGLNFKVLDAGDPLGDALRGGGERKGWGLDMMGTPLISYNVRKLQAVMGKVDLVLLPQSLKSALLPLRSEFGEIIKEEERLEGGAFEPMPLNSLAVRDGGSRCIFEPISEPWGLLEATGRTLKSDVTEEMISPDAEVADTAVISGPVVISEGAIVDDFCKIKGPTYIGPRSKVWTGSLVRESMIGPDCEIGFGCEVGRSYLMGGDRVAHHDVILDSVLGTNTWMGAFIGTTNKLLNNRTVKYKSGGSLVDTGLLHFGAVFGHDSSIGAGTIILPGRFIPPNTILQAGTVYSSPADVRTGT